MAFGSFSSNTYQAPMTEINMVPLIDVMLVLLIIFMITAPLMTHSVPVDLPRASSQPTPDTPIRLQVSITADNRIHLGGEPLDVAQLEARFRAAVVQDAKVELHLRVDRAARYEGVAETLSASRRAGLTRIGFVTQPVSK